MHVTTRYEANAHLIYRALVEERLDQLFRPASTLEEAENLLEETPQIPLGQIKNLFNTKMQEMQLKARDCLERINQELRASGENSFRTKKEDEFTPTFSVQKWCELYLNRSIKLLLEKFLIKYRGTLNSQGLEPQERSPYCRQVTDFVIRLIQKESAGAQLPFLSPLSITHKVQYLLLAVYDNEILQLANSLLSVKLQTRDRRGSPKLLREEILEQIRIQFPEHDHSLVEYRLLKNLPTQLKSSELYKETPTQTLRKLVARHLDPYIKNQKDPHVIEPLPSFLETCRGEFAKKHPRETLSERELFEVYLSYLIDEMHERYAFTHFGTADLRPTEPEERSRHCKNLLGATQNAIKRDFKGSSFLLPSTDAIWGEIQSSLKKLDAQGISLLTERFLNIKLKELKEFLLENPGESFSSKIEPELIEFIIGEIAFLFRTHSDEEIRVCLPSSLPDKLEALNLALQAWHLLTQVQ